MQNRFDLANFFKDKGFKIGAEIGVADGRFSLTLCKTIPDLKLFSIDPWRTYKGNMRGGGEEQQSGNYDLAKEKLAPYNVQMIREFSMKAVWEFDDNSLDFVFIDGNHDFDYVLEDIINWTRKVKPGGIVSGHDFYNFKNSGVIEAVYAYTGFHKIGLNIVGENKKGASDDEHPCWWFYKP